MSLINNQDALAIVKAISRDRQQAEHYLLYYEEELAKYEQGRAEYITKGGTLPETAGKDPTARKAERGIAYDQQSKSRLWLMAVEIVTRELSGKKRVFLRVRREAEHHKGNGFRRGRPGWVIQVQHQFADAMEREYLAVGGIWLAERTVTAWWQEIISRTADIYIRLQKK